MTVEKILIVDGHSAIFSTPDLEKLHVQSGRSARAELVRALTHYQDTNEVSVVVVFDGKGKKTDIEPRQDADIMVMYSRNGQSADSIIERIAAKQAEKYDVLVASNDRMVLDTVSAFGAHPMSIRGMWEIVG